MYIYLYICVCVNVLNNNNLYGIMNESMVFEIFN